MQVVSHSRWHGTPQTAPLKQSVERRGSAEVTENCAPCVANGSVHDAWPKWLQVWCKGEKQWFWKARLVKNKECFPFWILVAFFGWLIFLSLFGGGHVDCLVWFGFGFYFVVIWCFCSLLLIFCLLVHFCIDWNWLLSWPVRIVSLSSWEYFIETFFQVCVLLEPIPASYFLTQFLLWGRTIRSYFNNITSEQKLVVWNLALHYQVQ